MNPSGIQVRGSNAHLAHDRGLISFGQPVELGIMVPFLDQKFINEYDLVTAEETPVNASVVEINESVGFEISPSPVRDFDDNVIANAYVGPSTVYQHQEDYSIRPGSRIGPTTLGFGTDVLGNGSSIPFPLGDKDAIAIGRRPNYIVETDAQPNEFENTYLAGQIPTAFTIRKPKLINVGDHINTMFGNFEASDDRYLCFPITDKGAINPSFLYRFSFYYRVAGEMTVTPIVQYFTNTGILKKTTVRTSQTFIGADTEDSDFKFFDLGIPGIAIQESIPREARRIRVILHLESAIDSKLEMAYPIIEYVLSGSAMAVTFIPDPASALAYEDIYSFDLMQSAIGTIYSFDSAKLFFGHYGRKRYACTLNFDLLDGNFVDQVRTLENANERGDSIVLRPQHHNLPAAMVGDINVDVRMPIYDHHVNNLTLKFTETK